MYMTIYLQFDIKFKNISFIHKAIIIEIPKKYLKMNIKQNDKSMISNKVCSVNIPEIEIQRYI